MSSHSSLQAYPVSKLSSWTALDLRKGAIHLSNRQNAFDIVGVGDDKQYIPVPIEHWYCQYFVIFTVLSEILIQRSLYGNVFIQLDVCYLFSRPKKWLFSCMLAQFWWVISILYFQTVLRTFSNLKGARLRGELFHIFWFSRLCNCLKCYIYLGHMFKYITDVIFSIKQNYLLLLSIPVNTSCI